jgi:hypothetical protein
MSLYAPAGLDFSGALPKGVFGLLPAASSPLCVESGGERERDGSA